MTAETVANGKQDPECYKLGLRILGLHNQVAGSILVLEDAPTGAKAGKVAGCKVLGLVATHRVRELKDAGEDWIVSDLQSVMIYRAVSPISEFEVHLFDLLS